MRSLIFLVFCFMSFSVMAAEGVAEPSTLAIILGCLFAVSEVLAQISSLNSNSIFQLIKTVLAALLGSVKK